MGHDPERAVARLRLGPRVRHASNALSPSLRVDIIVILIRAPGRTLSRGSSADRSSGHDAHAMYRRPALRHGHSDPVRSAAIRATLFRPTEPTQSNGGRLGAPPRLDHRIPIAMSERAEPPNRRTDDRETPDAGTAARHPCGDATHVPC
jgi:hypothetical protein